MAPPFDELLVAARSGDQLAFVHLWRAHSPWIHGFLRAQGVPDPEATTNEVFASVFRSIGSFTGGPDAFTALLFTVARRRVVDERRRTSRTLRGTEWSDTDDARVVPSAEDRALEASGSEWTRLLLEQLSGDQRDVLLLRIYGDLTVDQAAAVLGKRPGAVKALQRRGLARLREHLVESDELGRTGMETS